MKRPMRSANPCVWYPSYERRCSAFSMLGRRAANASNVPGWKPRAAAADVSARMTARGDGAASRITADAASCCAAVGRRSVTDVRPTEGACAASA